MGIQLLLLFLITPSYSFDCFGLFERMIDAKTLLAKKLPKLTINYRIPDWDPKRVVPRVSHESNANTVLAEFNESFVAGMIRDSELSDVVKTILNRYSKQEHISHRKLIFHELSEPSDFYVFTEDGMSLKGFSYFENAAFSSKNKKLILVLLEIGMPDIAQGSINTSGKTSLAFARLANDLVTVGFAAKFKHPSLKEVEIYGHSIINPFLIEELPKLGFKDLGTREVKNKTGGIIAIGHDYSSRIRFKN